MKKIALETCDVPVRELVKLVAQGEAIILTEDDVPRYVLGAMDEFEWEVLALSHNQEFMDYLDQARERGRVEVTLSLAEVRRRLNLPARPETNTAGQ